MKQRKNSLGAYEPGNRNIEGRSPGMVGRLALGPEGRVVDDILQGAPPESCIDPRCLPVWSRFLEQTYRNFQMTFKLSSFIQVTWKKKDIHAFEEITIPGGMYGGGDFVKVICYTVGKRSRAVVDGIAHSLESFLAWSDVEWRLTVDDQPYAPYTAVRFQVWPHLGGKLPSEIKLRGSQRVCVEARSLSTTSYVARAGILGWEYYPLAECGDEKKSTLAS